jgi:hypothetical protein
MQQCSFELNGEPLSQFKIGAAAFPAFSGLGSYMNRRVFACAKNLGPIPPGTYFILDRQSGGFLGPLWDRIRGYKDWFSLYANDGRIDDKTYCNQVLRGNFRLHPKLGLGISKGCITIENVSDFNQIRARLKSNKPIKIKGADFFAYGTVIVK